MPTTNRPFFANFFAAFRAHSALQKASSAITSTANGISASSVNSSARSYHAISSEITSLATLNPSKEIPVHGPSTHRPSTYSASAVTSAAPQSHFRSSRPLHPPNGTPHNSRGRARSASRDEPSSTTPPFARSRAPSQTRSSASVPAPIGAVTSPSQFPQQRRGSDASEGSSRGLAASGMLAASPVEKWYIGGRTAHGEERFYKLVKTTCSADRLSLDRLSL